MRSSSATLDAPAVEARLATLRVWTSRAGVDLGLRAEGESEPLEAVVVTRWKWLPCWAKTGVVSAVARRATTRVVRPKCFMVSLHCQPTSDEGAVWHAYYSDALSRSERRQYVWCRARASFFLHEQSPLSPPAAGTQGWGRIFGVAGGGTRLMIDRRASNDLGCGTGSQLMRVLATINGMFAVPAASDLKSRLRFD
jgi:hypothetical protein